MKKIVLTVGIIGLLGSVGWIFFTMLAWQIPSPAETHALALADLDGDGDLDAFLANGRNEAMEPNTVLWNNGRGIFQDSGQRLGEWESVALSLADFDRDGDTDVLVSNIFWAEYFWNDGRGHFSASQAIYMPTTEEGFHVGRWRFKPGDLNGDGWLDLLLVGCCGGGISRGAHEDEWQTLNATNAVWLSDDSALLKGGGQRFGLGSSEDVALADLDGDGDLDAFLANNSHLDENGAMAGCDANEVWFNDGRGAFTDSGQLLGSQCSHAVAVGDLDGDGDVDALVGNNGPDEIWWNDGRGHFRVAEQTFGDTRTRYVYLADLDGDGDLDAFLGSDKRGRVLLNDGRGYFSDSGQRLNYPARHAIALGDVNGDGAVDVIAGKLGDATVWFNDGAGQLQQFYAAQP